MKRNLPLGWVAAVLLGSLAPPLLAAAGDGQMPATPAAGGAVSEAAVAETGYPTELLGSWLPPDISCATIDTADSDALVVIQRAQLNRYEDVHRFQAAERIADVPATWLIRSLWSIGGDEPHESANVFVLSGRHLAIVGDGSATIYRKCR